jgi:signal transduction histidine kinase
MPTSQQPRLAYVEDNDALRYATSRILREGGFTVLEADTGAEALRLVRSQPDLVLLDVRLPDMSGFEVCRRIKADPATASIPVLHLSHTYGAGDKVAEGLDGGADGYLTQPAEPRVLLATIRALLRARTAETQLRTANRRLEEVLAEREDLLRREAEARQAAEEASALKDQFLATLSHELRTPLNAIIGWIHVLGTAGDDEAMRGRAIEVIGRNARQQARLIEEILDVSRIVSGKLSLAVRDLDWVQTVEAAVEAVRPGAEAKGLRVEVVLERVPAAAQGDPGRLQQVISNLLSNAVKFSERGRIEVRLGVEGSHVRLSVADEGVGMDSGFLPFAFERFRQEDASPSRTQPGLGLGLTIVRHLVERHGGTVAAESAGPGRGARFTVRVPLAVRREVEGPAEVETGREQRRGSVGGLSVLVVENDADGLNLIDTVLQREGARVALAASAAEARSALQAEVPDAILCDIGMPGEHGLDFAAWVRSQPAMDGVTLVALTAYASDDDRARGLAAGFDLYVTKPFDPEELLRSMAEVMARRGQRAAETAQ